MTLPASVTGDGTVRVVWEDEEPVRLPALTRLLRVFGDLLPTPLSGRMALEPYAEKLIARAHVGRAIVAGTDAGAVVLYANDEQTRCGHIPLIAVRPEFRGQGIGAALLSRAMARCRQRGMRGLDLEVDEQNERAIALYTAAGFRAVDRTPPKLRMFCPLPDLTAVENPTPVEAHPRLANALGIAVDLRLKRDDLFPMAGGGIKARKIRYIVREAIERGHDVIVTNGGPQSNHARATAVLCAELGLRCHLVVVLEPGRQYPDTGNVLLMRLSGATIEFCIKEDLAQRMDEAMNRFRQRGHHPFYVWGGGHCLAGTVAFVDAATEARQQCGPWQPHFLVACSATGSTQAGFAIGYASTPTRVIGISAARVADRGAEVVRQCVDEYFDHGLSAACSRQDVRIEFLDEWTDGGYERTSPALLDVVRRAARVGVFVDPTYSGKALRGLAELAGRGDIPRGSRVLFWHTGGLMNLQACELAGDIIRL